VKPSRDDELEGVMGNCS